MGRTPTENVQELVRLHGAIVAEKDAEIERLNAAYKKLSDSAERHRGEYEAEIGRLTRWQQSAAVEDIAVRMNRPLVKCERVSDYHKAIDELIALFPEACKADLERLADAKGNGCEG